MQTIVVKFGGSSLADAGQIKKAADIVKANTARRYVVVSAPGKRTDNDTKVTDLLYKCYDLAAQGENYRPVLAQIQERFTQIAQGLDITVDLTAEFEEIDHQLSSAPSTDYMASRGEYLNGKLIAAYLGFPFLDAAELIRFDDNGQYDEQATNALLVPALLKNKRAVIPGFYGALKNGQVHTFSRGGSDVTGSIVAKAAGATVYENWTDVSGMLVADPRIVENPKPIDIITYKELRELSYMGASVLHQDAVFPARSAGIPINIRNTNHPDDKGTMIVRHIPGSTPAKIITGIAGTRGFTSVLVEKAMMNSEIGFGAKVLQIFADFDLSFEHLPSGIDTLSVILETEPFEKVKTAVLAKITEVTHPDDIKLEDHLAMVAVVGHGMAGTRGLATRVFGALAKANVNICMIDQGSSELNIILGIREADYETAIRALYNEFEAEL